MSVFGFEIDPQTFVATTFPAAGRVILIVIIALTVQKITSKAIAKTIGLATARHKDEEKEEFEQRIDTISGVFAATIGVVIWALTGFIILSELGINITPILTGAGIAGLAVGFGAQNLVRDILSGLFILIENQYTRGDVVRITGIEGKVEDVNLRRTVLRDLDGIVHSIPNGEIKTASNLTQEFSRINLNLQIEGAKSIDIDNASKQIDEAGKNLAKDKQFGSFIIEAPHVLRVEELAKEGVVLKIAGKTKPIRQWEVMGGLRLRLKETFDKQDITIYEKK
ncbi:MAG TPA: mechanosensitive ion channel family protein [Candidatus Nanoarchaeia archaeon]